MLVAIVKLIEGAGGARLTPGLVVNAEGWRNADVLFSGGYIRPATTDEAKTYRQNERVAAIKEEAHG